MENLIKVNYDTEQPTVSARDLHGALEIKERFSAWAERLLNYFGNEDMTSVLTPTEVQNNGGVQVRELQDYILSVDTAKHICLMSRTEKGKQCRQYLIDLEKAWNTPEQVIARALRLADDVTNSLRERCKFLGGQVVEQQKVIDELQPKASYYDLVLQCEDLIPTTLIAKDYGMSAKGFNALLHKYGIQFKQRDVWVLYADYQGKGYMKMKTHSYEGNNGSPRSKEHSYWTQKGRLFLYDFLKNKGILPLMERE